MENQIGDVVSDHPDKLSSVAFEELHGKMNMENNNVESEPTEIDGKAQKKSEEFEILETLDTDRKKEEEEDGQIEEIARSIIDKTVVSAMDKVEEDSTESDAKPEKAEEEKEDEWMDILGNGQLMKKTLTPGQGVDSRPSRQQEVTIRYEAKLEDGKVAETNDRLTFVLSDRDVMDVLDLSVSLMARGETALVRSAPKYAYGEEGKPPSIPPNSDIIFEIELLDVEEGPYNKSTQIEKRLDWADKKRQRGNEFYSKKDYSNAAETYTKCLKVLEMSWFQDHVEEVKKQISGLRLKCYNNLAASQMKLEKWSEALRASKAAEKLEPENVKALFRKGKIEIMMGELDKGTVSLAKANKLEPDNKVIAAELAKQKKRLELQKEAQKKMYRRMLGTTEVKKPQVQKTSTWMPSIGWVVAGTVALGAVLLGIYVVR